MAMRCKRCRGPIVIEVRRHNAAFCRDCFFHYVGQQVTRAIAKHRMLAPTDRVLVAVSGGKDSLALWDLLLQLGYQTDGLYLGLGIGGYSERSKEICRGFAAARGAKLVIHDLAVEQGYTIPQAASHPPGKHGRSSCGVCGLSKRYVFNRAALEGGYDVVATGHNLDDEAAVLFGNTLRWDTAAYCVLKGIDYVIEECPLVAGNTQMRHKETLNQMEEASPGTKHTFLFGYLDKAAALLRVADDADLTECSRCGMVTVAPGDRGEEAVCAFCRSRARLVGDPARAGAALPLVERVEEAAR